MELPIIILIDIENLTIHCFGKMNMKIPFSRYFLIPILFAEEKILCINDLVDTDIESVLSVLEPHIEDVEQKLYIRCNIDGFTTLRNSNYTLYGPKYPKLIENYDILKNKHLQEMIKNKQVEIINEEEAKKIKKIVNPNQSNKDDELDKMILNQSTKSIKENGLQIEIDEDQMDEITNETEVEDESESIIKKLGLSE